MPLPSGYRNPGRWRAVIFQSEVRHGTAGCLLSLVLLAPLLVRTWGLGRVLAAVLLYSCLLVPALTNYFSASRLLLRFLRLLNHVASHSRGCPGYQLWCFDAGGADTREGIPGYTWLILLVAAPYLLYLLRARPFLLLGVALLYVTLVLPMSLSPQMPQGSLLGLLRAVLALANKRSPFSYGLATSLASTASRAIHWVVAFVRQVLRCLLRAVALPFVFVFGCALPILHTAYLSFDSFRVTSNQVVFFLLVQELVTPLAYLTALYFLLFYTVLHYLHKALFGREWTRMVETTQQPDGLVVHLAARYVVSRLAKGVAMSFVMVMFTLQFSHVEPDLPFVASTFCYFVVTQKKWTGNERIVSWVRALRLEPLEEEEEFWVPLLLARVAPAAVSACAAAPLATACPRLVLLAAYTNLLVPWLLLKREYREHVSQHAALATRCSRATPQEASSHSPCPVCLEELRQARVTPCHHYYHVACLRRCLLLSPLCPLCKQVI